MKDPVETFPSEVLSPFFALFNNKELAILSAVCRSWRRQIQTDIIINRILDLTRIRVGRDLSQDQTIELVQRLASFSSYPKNQIHLSLKPFFGEAVEEALKVLMKEKTLLAFDAIMQSTSSKYASLLSTISSATKGKLSHLSLIGPIGRFKDKISFSIAGAIIEGVFVLGQTMELLDAVSLLLPLPVSLESRGSRNFKLFESEGRTSPEHQWDLNTFLTLIKKVTRFTGGSLFSLDFAVREFADVENQWEVLREVFAEMEKSTSTLKELDLGMDTVEQSQATLACVVKCQHLSRLNLSFGTNEFEEQVFFPTTALISSLQELNISLFGLPLDWFSTSLASWMGTNLKTLRITQEGSSVKIPMDFLKALLNANPLLEDVSFRSFRISPSLGSVSANAISLPRLGSLMIYRLDHLHELLSGAFLPSLSKLRFFPRDEEGQVQIPSLSDIFLPVLRLCQSSITDLQVSDDYALENAGLTSGMNDVVELGQVEILRFFRGSVNLVKLFSHFAFGKLKSLELDRTSISIQDVARLLVGSNLSLENVNINGSKRKRKGKDVELLRGCSFPKLKSLKLRKGSSHILELFSQASFGVLETLKVDYVESLKGFKETNLEQASFCSFLKIMESNYESLREASFNGTTKDKEEFSSPPLPIPFIALEDLSISFKSEISATLLVPFTIYRFPWLDTLEMSIVPPEPKQIGLEQACRAIASTTDYLPDLVVSRSEHEIKAQAC